MTPADIPVVILAGGLGTRLREETETKPKPMVEVGSHPILWHIMKHYAAFGAREFVVCLGYKGESIKDFFLNYRARQGSLSIDLSNGQVTSHETNGREPWKVHLLDTGANTMTGGRIKQAADYLGRRRFFATYGDGVSDVDIGRLLKHHVAGGRTGTITAVRPPARFGGLTFEGSQITSFAEKPQVSEGWINGGFMVFEPEVADLIDGDDVVFERGPLETLADTGQLSGFQHHGFWQCMDTVRDLTYLRELWHGERATLEDMDMSTATNSSPFGGDYAGRRVLVTGHTGFKGSWLTAWLARLGATVCGFADGVPTVPSLFEDANLSREIRHEIGDIRDLPRLHALIRDFKPDVVFHLAAQAIVSTSFSEPMETFSVNVMGTCAVLDALRSVDWPCAAVMITSDKAYDNVEWPWGYRETDRLGGKDIYSGSKGGAELAFNSYFHSFFAKPGHSVRLASARAGNVIGGGDWAKDRIVADCVRAWSVGEQVKIRSPEATRPWQHVLEPLSGYLTLGSRLMRGEQLHGESFNFGPRGEQNATVVELLTSLTDVWGFENVDRSFAVVDQLPFHEAGLLKLNIDKALLQLRWAPNLSYGECVDMTGTWYRDVVRQHAPALETTLNQIDCYVDLAVQRSRVWAA